MIPLVMCLWACGSEAPAPEVVPVEVAPVDLRAEVVPEVEALLERYRAAVTAADEAELRLLLQADDFAWVESGGVAYGSVDALIAALQAFPEGSTIETAYSDTAIEPLGRDGAWIRTQFETQVTQPSGPSFAFGGAITMAAERTDGSWRLVGGHTSVPPRKPSEAR